MIWRLKLIARAFGPRPDDLGRYLSLAERLMRLERQYSTQELFIKSLQDAVWPPESAA